MRPISQILLYALLGTIFVNCTRTNRIYTEPTGNAPVVSPSPESPSPVSNGSNRSGNGGGDSLNNDGPGSGNGGKGVLIDGKPYILDLVEAGLEKDPYFPAGIQVSKELHDRVAVVFKDDPSFPVDLIAQKLTQVTSHIYWHGLIMLEAMELYRWRLVNLSPAPVSDQRNGVKVEPTQYVQLANRLRKSIIINRAAWDKMDAKNRTALIFHEVIYAFAKPLKNKAGFLTQDTGAVQEANAFLFSRDFKDSDLLRTIFYDILPTPNWGSGFFINDHYTGEVIISPTAQIIYAEADPHFGKGKPLWDRKVDELNHEDAPAEAVLEVCQNLPPGTSHIRYNTRLPTVLFSIQLYESESDKFHSYVNVRQGEEVANRGISNAINKENCSQVVKDIYEEQKNGISLTYYHHI